MSSKAILAITPSGSICFHGMIYISRTIDSLMSRLKVVAVTDEVVLVLGETGAGKELVARAVHQESKRRARPFVAFNCSALSRELIESRLFGYRKGAFTGAHADHPGIIRAAAGGSVFLDEIGDLTLEAQGALLRFLQSGEIQPVGAALPVTANVRVIAATNRDLRAEVERDRFRKDLYYRLNVATLFLPPLWERPDDVKELARHFACVYSKQYGMPEPEFSPEEMAGLVDYKWPGNVRELENYIKRRILFGEMEIRAIGLVRREDANVVTWRSLSDSEKLAGLNEALESTCGNVTLAARHLGISRRTAQRFKKRQSPDDA